MTQLSKLLVIIGLSFFWANLSAQSYISVYNKGHQALENGDYLSYRNNMMQADSLRPNHPVIMYNLARGYALNDENEKAFSTLEILLHFYASSSVLDSSDFEGLIGSDEWKQLCEDARKYQKTIKSSEVAFEFEMPGLHPEGIAYDNESGDFYLSDIREGLIYRFSKKNKEPEPFIDLKEFGFWSALGIKIDPVDSDILWVTTSAMPEFSGYNEDLKGSAALLKFSKKTGQLLMTYKTDEEQLLGDLTITRKGKIYLSDSHNPVIYTIENNDVMRVAFQHMQWWNLQGLALSDDEEFLYVSDYITGIYRIHIESGEIVPLIDENERLRGGDGIYQNDGKLIILQNGTTPKRVAQIELGKSGYGISETLKFTDQARDDVSEPTLGAWVDGDLYYIGNSPWGFYDDNGQQKMDQWPTLKIFRLKK